MDETRGRLHAVATGVLAGPAIMRDDARPLPAGDASARGRLLALLTLQAAAFALASASGKIPAAVITLFRALLTF